MSFTEITGKTYEIIVVDNNNRPTEYGSSDELDTSNNYDKLINLIKEQNELLS